MVDLVCFESFVFLVLCVYWWTLCLYVLVGRGQLCLLACTSLLFKTCDLTRFNKKDDVWVVFVFKENVIF